MTRKEGPAMSTLAFRLPDDLRDALRKRALSQERTVSGEIRAILRMFLRKPADAE